jgi:hypothetical protein
MAAWKEETGYDRRSIAEKTLYRLKQLFGDSLASRLFETQVTEMYTRIPAMNVMTYLGMPISVRVGTILSCKNWDKGSTISLFMHQHHEIE